MTEEQILELTKLQRNYFQSGATENGMAVKRQRNIFSKV